MAERTCEVCGAKNPADARFCWNCDSYLGWDVGGSTLEGEALTGTIPKVIDTAEGAPDAVSTDGGGAGGEGGEGTPSSGGRAKPPDAAGTTPSAGAPPPGGTAAPPDAEAARDPDSPIVTAEHPEVTVTADAPGVLEVEVENVTGIVDGYAFEVVDPPSWLDLGQPDVHLMPGESRTFSVTFGIRPETMVVAQRVPLTLVARSVEAERRRTPVDVVVVVPPHGPRIALEAHPSLIRLEDSGTGSFTVRLDNRGANYPQTLEMSASDTEGVVEFEFTPSVVQVPPGAMVEVPVSFVAAQPAPGQQLNRQLTVTATNDEGPVVTMVSLVQSTAAAPVDAPITLQLEPSSIHLVDAIDAEFEVLVDNRGGHSGVTVTLSGRDPERRLAFAFVPARFVAVAGHVTRAHGRLRGDLPSPGATATHPFTVVATDATTDVEATGVLEIASSAAAIATAELHVAPQKLDLGTRRDGAIGVEVDNRRGSRPLNVTFTGRSDDGMVRAMFVPAQVAVAPGAVGHTRMSVSSPHPPAGKSGQRSLEIVATDGAQQLTATAELVQTGPDRRRPASRWLTFFGALLVLLGAVVLPWFGPEADLDVEGWVGTLLGDWSIFRGMDSTTAIDRFETPLRILLVVLAVMMLFGMAGRAGGLTRKSAIVVVLLTVGFVVYTFVVGSGQPDFGLGLPVIWLGAVLAYIGGMLARPRE